MMLALVGPASAPANALIYPAGFVNGLRVEHFIWRQSLSTEDSLRADL